MYCSVDDIKNKIDEKILLLLLNDENNPSATLDTEVIAERLQNAINTADREIDSYLSVKYKLPLQSVPERIKDISSELAIYYCYKRRHLTDMPEDVSDNYKMLIKTLVNISKGVVKLNIEETENNRISFIKTNKTSSDRTFNNDLMSRY